MVFNLWINWNILQYNMNNDKFFNFICQFLLFHVYLFFYTHIWHHSHTKILVSPKLYTFLASHTHQNVSSPELSWGGTHGLLNPKLWVKHFLFHFYSVKCTGFHQFLMYQFHLWHLIRITSKLSCVKLK